MIYYVLEMQSNVDSGSVIPTAYTSKTEALAAFYNLCSVAVASDVPIHCVKCINAYGVDVEKTVFFEHEAKTAKKSSK